LWAPDPQAQHIVDGLHQSTDIGVPAKAAFGLVCEIEKWPVWLSFLRSARRLDPARPLGMGSDIAIRSEMPGDEEELFEVDRFVDGYMLSLVGAYSVKRRIEMRVEGKTNRSKLVVRVDYPVHGGAVAQLVDRLGTRRRLEHQLTDSLAHFKGLIEDDGAPYEDAVLVTDALAVVDANC
jgi:uncharacterized membrane protein